METRDLVGGNSCVGGVYRAKLNLSIFYFANFPPPPPPLKHLTEHVAIHFIFKPQNSLVMTYTLSPLLQM